MRILVASDHVYPAFPSIKDSSAHAQRNYASSFSSRFLQDLIVQGLAQLGHDVFYWLGDGHHRNVPEGVQVVNQLPANIDIAHLMYCTILKSPIKHLPLIQKKGIPWVGINHLAKGKYLEVHRPYLDNLIFVSKYAAKTFGLTRYVYNGFDPDEYLFQEEKEDYFFFIAAMNKAEEKGLSVALNLAQKMGFPLIVAGNAPSPEIAEKISRQCKAAGAEYIGPVYGMKKAKLFARARAVLFPTLMQESFGGIAVEAMMSGTPVITSNRGALPEIMHPDVGFVCANQTEYENAIKNIQQIAPVKCRQYSVTNFHYLQMAKGYATAYQKHLEKNTAKQV